MADTYIIDVWSANLVEEIKRIREASKTHTFVFISVLGSLSSREVHCFRSLSPFLNHTKVIQIGITLSNKNGGKAKFMDPETEEVFHCAWQFNISGFNPNDDQDQDELDSSHITRLQQGGVNLHNNWHHGVPMYDFLSHMLKYKLLNNRRLHWIAFDGAFCFGQLIKFANMNVCPPAEHFLTILGHLFPVCYDINQVMRSTSHVPASIEDVGKLLRVRVDGEEVSLAASRSVLIGGIFHKVSHLATPQLCGVLYGTEHEH